MALPTSGSLSLSQVRTEFGAPTNTGLSAFLRGGAWVPDTAANAGVPTALPISLRQLLGASAVIGHSVSAPDINDVVIGATPKASGTSHATVSGGVGPFTYSWAFIAGGTGITLTNTTSSTVTAQRSTGSSTFGVNTGSLRCSVTDLGNGSLVTIWDISATLENGV